MELMVVVAVGHPADRSGRIGRKELRELILKEF